MTHNKRPLHRRISQAIVSIAVLGLLCQCNETGNESQGGEELLARSRAAAFFHKDQMSAARDELASLVANEDASLALICDAASIEFAAGEYFAAEWLITRAARLDSTSPRVTFIRAQLLRVSGKFEEALPLFILASEALPNDLPTLVCLADVQHGLDQTDAAIDTLERVIAVGPENGTAWYYSAIYRMSRIMVEEGRDQDADRYFEIIDGLKERGYDPPTDTAVSRGTQALALSPEPAGNVERKVIGEVTFDAAEIVLPELANAKNLLATDLNGDRRVDLLAWGEGIQAGYREPDDTWTAVRILEGPIDLVVPFDMDNDGDQDLLVVKGSPDPDSSQPLELWRVSESGYQLVENVPLPVLEHNFPGPALAWDAVAVDIDHEGDLDLVLAGSFGVRVWRNDGVASEEGGQFTEIETPGLSFQIPVNSITFEDLDADQDVDLVIDNRVFSSLRGGRFEELTALPGAESLGEDSILADFSGDGRPDVFQLQETGAPRVGLSQPGGGWKLGATNGTINQTPRGLIACDLDLDGATDVFFGAANSIGQGLLAAGTSHSIALLLPEVGSHSVNAFCFPGGDLACSTPEGIALHAARSRPHPGFMLSLQGVRDNRSGVGAIVEMRSGTSYRRIFWDGVPKLVGMGSKTIDILRITWPNGVLQEDLDLDLIARTSLENKPEDFGHYKQVAGLVGSCPFLYTWNGETYEFISDVLGITPLGLPMAPGMLVPPDHDEYVLIRGDQLKAKDGVLSMQITEELREVTYLDGLRLHVIDHADDVDIFPTERFTFPPFPIAHTHTVRDTISATRVTGSDGKDWTAELAALDNTHPIPFETYEQQFMGLATPHFLELEFAAEALKDAEKLRILMTGWLFWTNASINMASSRHEGIAFVPPILQVPDGSGGWRDTGPPVGFPAGKTKTMVLDITDLLNRDDPRLRVFSTLQLYWDQIVLAVDDDSAALAEVILEPLSAKLWDRGFSRSLENERVDQVERFDWNQVESTPRWNQHPGFYTRYGEAVSLLTEVDDRYIILGTGDALEVQFDAKNLPKLKPGMKRDYLLYLDGWAKDRDPNTIEALNVEPLPFHGMSGYPYTKDEHFPSDEVHDTWRAEWNTRPAKHWIRPLAPLEEARWLLDG